MERPDRGRRPRKLVALLVALVVVAIAGVGAWRLDLLDPIARELGLEPGGSASPSGPAAPAEIPAPPALDLPAVVEPDAVLEASDGGARVDEQAVAAALAPYLDDADAGGRLLAAVAPLEAGGAAGGPSAFVQGPDRVTPASTTKLLTAVAALETLGPEHRFTTRVVSPEPGRIVLVGGGDPLLARAPAPDDEAVYPERADLRTLARATVRALRAEGRSRVRLSYDASLFTGPSVNPAWPPSYVPDGVVSPISALWVDRGVAAGGAGRDADPPLAAAAFFADELERMGVGVAGEPATGLGGDAEPLAAVSSAPLSGIVERLLEVSDNETTEVLAHHVGREVAGDASFAGGASATREVLAGLGVDLGGDTLRDGSGLSRDNRLSAGTLLGVLRVAASGDHPGLRATLTGLPVAGFNGSLGERFASGEPAGRGAVRAKTGTLTGVQGLAGTVVDAGGVPLLFVLIADRVPADAPLDARQVIDEAAAALAACRCAVPAEG